VERQEQHVESRQKWQWLSRIWKRRLWWTHFPIIQKALSWYESCWKR
jgi:hypothetical protein